MKFTVSTKSLLDAVNKLSKISNSYNPLLNNILLKTDQNRVVVSRTNCSYTQKFDVVAKILESGERLVDPKMLKESLKLVMSDSITLELIDGNLSIQEQNNTQRIESSLTDEYPPNPFEGLDIIHSFELMNCELYKYFKGTSFAAPKSNSLQPALEQVFFDLKNGLLNIVSTDTKRAVWIARELKSEPIEYKIPIEVVRLVENCLNKKDRSLLKISKTKDEMILLELGNVAILTKSVDNRYPQYESVFPKEFNWSFMVSRKNLLDMMKKLVPLAKSVSYMVRFEMLENTLSVIVVDSNGNKFEQKIATKILSGSMPTIHFNSSYIVDFLNSVESDTIVIKGTTSSYPAVFIPGDDSVTNYKHVLMPMSN